MYAYLCTVQWEWGDLFTNTTNIAVRSEKRETWRFRTKGIVYDGDDSVGSILQTIGLYSREKIVGTMSIDERFVAPCEIV